MITAPQALPIYDEQDDRAMRDIVLRQSLDRLHGWIRNGRPLTGSPYHEAPLLRAVSTGWTAGGRALLDAGVDVHAEHRGRSSLNIAVSLHRLDLVGHLLAAGADPNRGAVGQRQALHEAFAVRPPVKLVKALLAAGANPNALTPHGRTPLSMAVELSDSHELVRALSRAGADPTWPDADGRLPTDVLAQRTNLSRAARDKLLGALHAAFEAHTAREQALLRDALDEAPGDVVVRERGRPRL